MKMIKNTRWLALVLILTVAAAMMPLLGGQQAYSYGAASKLKAPANVKAVSANKNAVKISWSKVKKAKGYIVYRYDRSQRKYKAVKTLSAKKKSWTNKGLKTDKVYQYKVRAYQSNKGRKIKGKTSYTVSAKPQTKKSKTKNVKSIYMPRVEEGFYPGYSKQLYVYLEPDEKVVSKKLVWKSGNSKIAKVSKNGTITGLRPGKTYITARAHNGVTAKCKVVVSSYSAVINGKTIYLGEPISSVNKKFGKYYMGNLSDSFEGKFGKIDKRIKVYTYGSVGEPLVIAQNGRVAAFAATEASSFNVAGVKAGERKGKAMEQKLRKHWEDMEYFGMPDMGYYYEGNNYDYTSTVLVDVSSGVAVGFAIGGEMITADVAYSLLLP